ncbi:hypothetical protein HFP71_05600 [Streptomyces sp. ARC32]
MLSAKSEAQLAELARRLHARLGEATDADLPAIAWTLQTGRMALEERLAFAVSSLAQARERLAAFSTDPAAQGPWHRGTVRPDRPADAAAVRAALDAWTRPRTSSRGGPTAPTSHGNTPGRRAAPCVASACPAIPSPANAAGSTSTPRARPNGPRAGTPRQPTAPTPPTWCCCGPSGPTVSPHRPCPANPSPTGTS